MPDSWLSLPAGLLIATMASIVGIGGGILWMPFFIMILKLRPEIAVLTSLLIQTAGMGSGTLTFSRKKQIDFRLMLFLLFVTAPGIAFGAYLSHLLDPKNLEFILGILALATAMLFVSASHRYGDHGQDRAQLKAARKYALATGFLAVASGLLSVSIGEWLVPLMRSKLALRMRTAVATSIATIFGNCLLGVLFHFLLGTHANLTVVLWAVPGVIAGGQIGPRIAVHINDRILKEIFIFFLTLIGVHFIYNSF